MDSCIQMTPIQTSQDLIQLINMYVMIEKSWIILRIKLVLRKMPEQFDKNLKCVLLDNFNLHDSFWEEEEASYIDETAQKLIDMTIQDYA